MRYIRNLFELEQDYYNPRRHGNFYGTNYIKYKRNGDRNKILSMEGCPNENRL